MQRITIVRETQSLRASNASIVDRLSQISKKLDSKKASVISKAAGADGVFKMEIHEEDNRESLINNNETADSNVPAARKLSEVAPQEDRDGKEDELAYKDINACVYYTATIGLYGLVVFFACSIEKI